jgi:small GTP-binding protein
MDEKEPEKEPKTFDFDVFLSHSSNDKPVVRTLADRLKNAGLKVWFDEWEIQLGDPIHSKIRDGLERSRILLLFMSRNGFGSDWAALEYQTILFTDPLNRKRRFVPIYVDGDIPAVLRPFKYLDWRTQTEDAYRSLSLACRATPPPSKSAKSSEKSTPAKRKNTRLSSQKPSTGLSPTLILKGHIGVVLALAIDSNGGRAISSSRDGTVRVWNLEAGVRAAVLPGHEGFVSAVAITPDGRRAVSGSQEGMVRVWNLDAGTCTAVLEGSTSAVYSMAGGADGRYAVSGVAIAADGRRAVSCSRDGTVRVWDLDAGVRAGVRELYTSYISSVAIAADGRRAVSGSTDGKVRVWDLNAGGLTDVLAGHTRSISGVAITADGRRAVSSSRDGTVRVWNLEAGTCTAVLEGHTRSVSGVAIAADGRRAVSGSRDGAVRVWDLDVGICAAVLKGTTEPVYGVAIAADGRRAVSGGGDKWVRVWDLNDLPSSEDSPEDQSVYINAKVLLTGDSGAGKTGLAQRLVYNTFEATYSTDGVWATQLKIKEDGPIQEGLEREIWLWDFAGQSDYRLIHQLYMYGTDLALLVFDPQKDNPFEGLAQWNEDLTRAAGGRPYVKRLVAGRCDRGGLRVSNAVTEEFQKRHGFAGYHETSALRDDGCEALRRAILSSIPWDRLPKTSSPAIFKRIKEEVLKLKDDGRVLLRMAELKQVLELRMIGESFTPEILRTVVGLLANAGVVWPLDFGGYVLLQPERINAYAGALVRAVRAHSDEIGCIAETDVLHGKFPVPTEVKLKQDDEDVVLRSMVETLLKRGLCLKESIGGKMLVFPAYYRRDRPEMTAPPPPYVQYSFTGSHDEIYTTLVVSLHHTDSFERDQLWRDAADFKTPVTSLRAGLKLERRSESSGVITVFLDAKIPIELKATFMKFVHNHLTDELAHRASSVKRERFHVCDRCGHPIDQLAARNAVAAGKMDIYCQLCDDGHRVLLFDKLEELFQSPETAKRAKGWNREAQAVMDSQSLEQILLGHVQAIAGEAGQIWRPTSFGDHGIDGEIEFKNHQGQAIGRRIYLQLKSGNSYLETRKKDGAEIFRIKKDRHAKYWIEHPCPVWLVVRTTDELEGSSIRWMDLSAYLLRESEHRKTPVKQVEFRGEPFTAQTLMALRDRIVPPPTG